VETGLSIVAIDIRQAIALFLQALEAVWGKGEHGSVHHVQAGGSWESVREAAV
jgi:hypothetical protein